jgi:NitT/TauT family transport system permease protein
MINHKIQSESVKRFNLNANLRVEYISIPGVFVLFIFLWLAVAKFYNLQIIIPYPQAVLDALIQGFRQGSLIVNAWYTFLEAISGFVIAAFAGILFGSAISQIKILEKTLYPYLVALQTLPKIALAPLFIIWFGFGLTSKVVICAMIAFFPILVNTIAGLKATEQQQVDLFRAYCANRWQIFKWLKFPNALPYIFAGLNIAVVLSVIGAIVGEFVGAQVGLGKLILEYQFELEVAGVFAVLVVLGAMGIALHLLMRVLQRRIVFWSKPDVVEKRL